MKLSGEQLDALYLVYVAGFAAGQDIPVHEISDFYDDILDDEDRAGVHKQFRKWLDSKEGRQAAKLIIAGEY